MSPSELIDKQIASYPDWRGKRAAKLRTVNESALKDLIREAVLLNTSK
jgi:hypothetical protein